jgi:transforming growth factor-beta-induced protein
MRPEVSKIAGMVLAATLVSACGGGDDPDIAKVAEERGLSALLAAATKAGLADELADNSARLTVFAPSNAAFNTLATQLGFADANAMVFALPASALASILSYHLLPSVKNAATLAAAANAPQATVYSFSGAPAALGLNTSSGVRLTDAALTTANVTTADIDADNGVVHVIDKVLVPPGVLNVVQMAQVNPAFTSLVSAVSGAGLAGTLSGTGPFTVFAPTNTAFTAIAGVLPTLTPTQVSTVLTYHVLGSQVLSSQIPFGQPVATLAVQSITINTATAPLVARITDTTAAPAGITAVDVRASNGVIHVIDKVLLPNLGS